jgi:glycerophosphoryl diester phosphodiesterase
VKPWSLSVPVAAVAVALTAAQSSAGSRPVLEGRAVLPVETLAPGPPSGAFAWPVPQVVNGIGVPWPSQVVQGFSALVRGRGPDEYLALADNGFGSKANSADFLLRAYYLGIDFKTAECGTGDVEVRDFVSFRDPDGRIGFPIVNESTEERLLTGADLDPESLQRDHGGDLWVGEEFGPWIVHFDRTGKLLEAPYGIDVKSPGNPFLGGQPATQPNSRGFEGMAISPRGTHLYAALEGPKAADADKTRRFLYEFSTRRKAFTGRTWQYRTENEAYMISDMSMLDAHRIVVMERDAGRGLAAIFRKAYVVDLREVEADGFLRKTAVLDMAAISDPDLVSLPEIHEGDVGLGDPYRVTCESVEAIHVLDGRHAIIGCDNNIPNTGRNPGIADDSEFILVRMPGLRPGRRSHR